MAAIHVSPSRPPPVPPSAAVLDQHVDLDSLHRLRREVAAHADHLGATPDEIGALLVVATELTSNAVMHGGGSGRLRLWRRDGRLYCQVSDRGPGLADRYAGTRQPEPTAARGRGLWLCRQFCARLVIAAGQPGAVVTAVIDSAGPAAGGAPAVRDVAEPGEGAVRSGPARP